MSRVGIKIRHARAAAGMRQEDLASKASVRRATLSDIENGLTRDPRADVLKRICDALGVDMGWLMDETDTVPAAPLTQLDRIEAKLDAVIKFLGVPFP